MGENVALKTTTVCGGSESFSSHSWTLYAYKVIIMLTLMISCAATDAVGTVVLRIEQTWEFIWE